MISSHKCMKLYFTCSFYHQEHLYKGSMFEKGGNVYIIAPSSTTPALIYNFSNEPGTIIKVGGFEIRIKEKKLAKYRGEDLNVIGYSILENEDYPFEGIEGIGFLGGGLTCLIDGYAPGATGGERSLKTCTVNGEVVFDLHEFYTSGQIVTGTSKPSASLLGKGNLYDLQGRRLGNGRWTKDKGQLRPGIYIMKGKKVLH